MLTDRQNRGKFRKNMLHFLTSALSSQSLSSLPAEVFDCTLAVAAGVRGFIQKR